MIVVSEIGEQWSPKTPPPRTAARYKGSAPPTLLTNGTAIGIIIANVPHEVPVEKEIAAETKKSSAGMNIGFSQRPTTPATYTPVPPAPTRRPDRIKPKKGGRLDTDRHSDASGCPTGR